MSEIATIDKTPTKINIEKTKHPIIVECKKEGFHDASEILESGADKWASSNYYILGVGFITRAIDSGTGADNHYPDTITLHLQPGGNISRVVIREPSAGGPELAAEEAASISIKSGTHENEETNFTYLSADGVSLGNFYALVIGINNYATLPKLRTAVGDAKAVGQILSDEYGYNVTVLIDPTRDAVLEAFDLLAERLGKTDNLLIYYAGHGWFDDVSNRGYWLPADAREDRHSRWLSNAEITDTLSRINANHVMVVADSCYSGSLMRAAPIGLRDSDYLRRITEKRARVSLTSGGLEPVSDGTSGGHSPFAAAFMQSLNDNHGIIDSVQLFSMLRRLVMLKSSQTPELGEIREAGHDGGDFVFMRTSASNVN